MEIRMAVRDDLSRITEIYNQGIADRMATLEADAKTEGQMEAWWEAHCDSYPVIVSVENTPDGSDVTAYACLNPFNSRCCYSGVCDFSIYVAREWRGKGIGKQLLSALEDEARRIGYHKLVLSTLRHNTPAIGLYAKLGYRMVGTYHEQGILDEKFVDVTIMEKIL